MLSARGVSLVRGQHALLRDVSLRLRPGEVTVILGPNGAGKTTLLRVLTGTLTAEHGEVVLNGRALGEYGARELAAQRAVLAQEHHLSFDFSVEEVVLLGRIPHLRGWEGAQDHAACTQALAAVELLAMRHRRYLSLSGGEKLRVHLARVLTQLDGRGSGAGLNPGAHGPAWLFLDEPTAALDLRYQHGILALLRDLVQEGASADANSAGATPSQSPALPRPRFPNGLGVCAVLHDLNLAIRYADRVLVMHAGRVAADGPPREVLTPGLIAAVYGVDAEWIATAHQDGVPLLHVHRSTHSSLGSSAYVQAQ